MRERQVIEGNDADSNVALLARLLSDRQLRSRFRDNASDVARELADDQAGRAFLLSLDHRLLEAQAETLITKRLHEVSQLLPLTWKRLADSAPSVFAAYADESVWPEGHNRHLFDAEAFACWLSGRQARDLVIAESNRLRFRLNDRRLSVHVFSEGLIPRVQILFRKQNGEVRESALGLH